MDIIHPSTTTGDKDSSSIDRHETLRHTQRHQKFTGENDPTRLVREAEQSMLSFSDPQNILFFQNQHRRQLHPCRWSWCRLTFATNAELASHVVNHHVQAAVPIRRMDVALYKRAEEGIGASLSMSDVGMSHPSRDDAPSEFVVEDKSIEEPTASFPSPPATSPPPHSATSEAEGEQLIKVSSFVRHPSSLQSESQIQNTPAEQSTPPQRQRSPPSFASLSSPIGPFPGSKFTNPPTPSFSSLVENAIDQNRRRLNGNVFGLSSPPTPGHSRIQGLSFSPDSSKSQDSVDKQLTQDIEGDRDHEIRHASRRSRSQKAFQSPGGLVSGSLAGQSSLQATPARQAWYGTRPARRLAPLVSPPGDAILPAQQMFTQPNAISTPSQPPNEPKATLNVPVYPKSQANSSTQSQSQSQDAFSDYFSYPPLQTQAPYSSQSFSQ